MTTNAIGCASVTARVSREHYGSLFIELIDIDGRRICERLVCVSFSISFSENCQQALFSRRRSKFRLLMDDRNSLLSFVLARYYFDGFLIGNVSELCESYKVKMCDFQVVESIELSCGL